MNQYYLKGAFQFIEDMGFIDSLGHTLKNLKSWKLLKAIIEQEYDGDYEMIEAGSERYNDLLDEYLTKNGHNKIRESGDIPEYIFRDFEIYIQDVKYKLILSNN